MAPVARVLRRKQPAARLMGAGRDDPELFAQRLAQRDERAAGKGKSEPLLVMFKG